MCGIIKKLRYALFKHIDTYKTQLDTVLDYLRSNRDVNIRDFCANDPFLKNDVDDVINELTEAGFVKEDKTGSGIYNLQRGGKLFKGYICNYFIKINKEIFKFVSSFFIVAGAVSSIFLVFREIKETIPKSKEVILVVDSSFVRDLNQKKNKSKSELLKFYEKRNNEKPR